MKMKLISLLLFFPLFLSAQITGFRPAETQLHGQGEQDEELFFTRAGITEDTTKAQIRRLVRALKYYNLWEKHYALWPMVGGDSLAHTVNIINPYNYNISWLGSDMKHDYSGVDMDSSASTLGGNGYGLVDYTNHHWLEGISIYFTDAANNFTGTDLLIGTHGVYDVNGIGNMQEGVGGFYLGVVNTGVITGGVGENDTNQSTGNNGTTGLFTVQRAYIDSVTYYANGSNVGTVYDSIDGYTSQPNDTLILCINCARVEKGWKPGDLKWLATHAPFSDSQAAKYDTIVRAFQSDLDRQTGDSIPYPYVPDWYAGHETLRFEVEQRGKGSEYGRRDGASAFVSRDTIYQLGGWPAADSAIAVSSSIFYSVDTGSTYTYLKEAEWGERHTYGFISPYSVKYKNKFWVIGGDVYPQSGNGEAQVWNSNNGLDWDSIGIRDFGTRVLHAVITHKPPGEDESIFVIGGQDDVTGPVIDRSVYKFDGTTWTQVCASCLPSTIGLYNNIATSWRGKIWLIGGAIYDDSAQGNGTLNNNVYSSIDGSSWVLEGTIPFGGTRYPSVYVSDGYMWIYGGGRSNKFTSWTGNSKTLAYTKDGKTWQQINIEDLPQNHAASFAVDPFGEKGLFITSGNHTFFANPTSEYWNNYFLKQR